MIFRSPEAKRDLIQSWRRPDRPFFASGACHILAGVFLEKYTEAGYRPFLISPTPGLRGQHVFVANDEWSFDYHGYVRNDCYFVHYEGKMRRFFPGWNGHIKELEDSPLGSDFCREHGHRRPDEFPHDPLPRALAFLMRFRQPDKCLQRS
jgi:hypothetical protein